MPPNSSLSDKPICVSDSFHFSSFYWKESSASLANLGGGEDDSPPTNRNDEDDSIAGLNTPGRRSRGVSMGSDMDDVSEAPMKVCCKTFAIVTDAARAVHHVFICILCTNPSRSIICTSYHMQYTALHRSQSPSCKT